MGLLGIDTLHNELRSGMPVDRPVELILYPCKKLLCGFRRGVVVQRSGIDVRDFLVEPPLGKTDLANPLQQVVEVLPRQHRAAVFQPLIVHGPALNGVILDDAVRPLAELHSTVIVDLEPNSNNHLQVVVQDVAADLAAALGLNYSEFPNSCRFLQFIICKNFLMCSLIVWTSTS